MRATAIVLLVVGTVVASLGGAKLPSADLPTTVAGVLLLVIGALLLRIAERRGRTREDSPHGRAGAPTLRELSESLDDFARQVSRISTAAEELETTQLRSRLDVLESEYLEPLEERARGTFPLFTRNTYAEVFGELAAGEVLLRRAWSASVDGHREESLRSLRRAELHISRVAAKVRDLVQLGGAPRRAADGALPGDHA